MGDASLRESFASVLDAARDEHLRWLDQVRPPNAPGGMAVGDAQDPERCPFGKWLSELRVYDNERILYDTVVRLHRSVHVGVGRYLLGGPPIGDEDLSWDAVERASAHLLAALEQWRALHQ